MQKELKKAKEIIKQAIENSGLKVEKLILFGSRARGEYRPDSDWDIYVIVNKDLSYNKKWEIILKIKRKLAELEIPNDIIINPLEWIEKYKNDVGRIIYYVLREGIEI